VLTLIFVPVFYAVLETWRERLSSTAHAAPASAHGAEKAEPAE
jgi:hypothetical protein